MAVTAWGQFDQKVWDALTCWSHMCDHVVWLKCQQTTLFKLRSHLLRCARRSSHYCRSPLDLFLLRSTPFPVGYQCNPSLLYSVPRSLATPNHNPQILWTGMNYKWWALLCLQTKTAKWFWLRPVVNPPHLSYECFGTSDVSSSFVLPMLQNLSFLPSRSSSSDRIPATTTTKNGNDEPSHDGWPLSTNMKQRGRARRKAGRWGIRTRRWTRAYFFNVSIPHICQLLVSGSWYPGSQNRDGGTRALGSTCGAFSTWVSDIFNTL